MYNKKIIFNWKMFGSSQFVDLFISKIPEFNINYDFIVCPPSPLFFKFSEIKKYGQNVFLGSQNCANSEENKFENSNYTGEINIGLLKEFNISHCIIGHSERRKYLNETEDMIFGKMENLLNSSIIPIICVRKFFEDGDFIKNIINSFTSLDFPTNEIILAYEPQSAIGTGNPENNYTIEENIHLIKNQINDPKLKEKGKRISILYGGSVSGSNIKEILNICDGVLIGKSSTSEKGISDILENI
jgi:triosephosphate isomerase